MKTGSTGEGGGPTPVLVRVSIEAGVDGGEGYARRFFELSGTGEAFAELICWAGEIILLREVTGHVCRMGGVARKGWERRMFSLGIVMIIVGGALLGTHYLGLASQIPGVNQISSLRILSAGVAIAGVVLVILFRRPAN